MEKSKQISKAKEGAIILAFRMKTEKEKMTWTDLRNELEKLNHGATPEEKDIIFDIFKATNRCSASWVNIRHRLEKFGEKGE
jgi:hypothetical protein